jgi:hypothetical protein
MPDASLSCLRHVQALTLVALLGTRTVVAQSSPTVQLVPGVTADGAATAQWLAMIRSRLSSTEYDSVAAIRHVLTDRESEWMALIESRRVAWAREIPALAMPFSPVLPPARALIVLANRGGGDAFAHDSTTIGFDLAELQTNYGPARAPGNTDLIDRLFRHEYTHLMQKAWFLRHPWQANSPLQEALVDLWLEGQGTYYSLSERWRRTDGRRSEATQLALSALEPRLIVRLSALACAQPEQARSLRKGLSSGQFDQKWGALPIALWLEDERPASLEALRRFVLAGPAGVWELADHHLPEPLRRALAEVRAVDTACTSPTAPPALIDHWTKSPR